MTRSAAGTLPLAFVLAMGADGPANAAQVPGGQDVVLRPGMFAGLLERAIGLEVAGVNTDQSGHRLLPGDKTAQFFPNFPNFPNFFNCFSGVWRNC